MILGCHGAFDSRTDANCGFSELMSEVREMGLSHNVKEIDVSDPLILDPFELTLEPNTYIGYSNGGDVVLSKYLNLLAGLANPHVTSANANFIFIDFVYRGMRQVFDRNELFLPSSVQTALAFLRTELTGIIPPYHTGLAVTDGKAFQNIEVASTHDQIPGTESVKSTIKQRLQEIYS